MVYPERNCRLVAENDRRKIWFFQKRAPDGEWIDLFRGQEFIVVEGRAILTPEKPLFGSKKEALEWLHSVAN